MSEYDFEEQSLEEHLTELRNRLIVVAVGVGLLSFTVGFLIGREVLIYLQKIYIPPDIPVNALSPMEYVYSWVMVSVYVGVVLGLPLIIYESFKFMAPGLYPTEKRFFLRVVPISLILFCLGGAVSVKFLIPLSISYLIPQMESVAEPFMNLNKLIGFVVFMLLGVGLLFQIPLLVSFLIKGGLVKKEELKAKRKFIYAGALVGGITLAPDPTPVTPLIVAFLLVVMYELSLLVSEYLL